MVTEKAKEIQLSKQTIKMNRINEMNTKNNLNDHELTPDCCVTLGCQLHKLRKSQVII